MSDKKTEKQNLKTLKQNQKLIEKYSSNKAKRHVKVKNEPVLDTLLNNLHEDYANEVVSSSFLEIIKKVEKDEI